MLKICSEESCTVKETNVCLRNYDPESCPHRIKVELESSANVVETETLPPLQEPEINPSFPNSFTLSLPSVKELMNKNYCHLIGVVGSPNAGKTALLVSLYLLLSKNKLESYSFMNSQTLMAFDEISQGARRWNSGQFPDQLTTHTQLDERSAGFLHLKLLPTGQSEGINLLIPDLPGEWSDEFIDRGKVDRLDFLKRSDVIWIMINGCKLKEKNTRQLTIHRTNLLIQTVSEFIAPTPKLILVITRKDHGPPNAADIKPILDTATTLKLKLEVINIASFAEQDTAAPGEGISELIKASLSKQSVIPEFWPQSEAAQDKTRAIMKLRR
jgi:Double-GTPase 2